ncbi:MAG: hypothetical protein HKN47_03085 [Pirellulaceae bacterium]|nr:hypothetical protein [Pirellulaceae bacterium]
MSVASTSTRTLAINPAFLEEIKESNRELWQTHEQLRQVFQVTDSDDQVMRQLVQTLDTFRDQLATQFQLEESFGYQPVDHQSSSQRQFLDFELVDQVCRQHCALYLRITDLAERAEEMQYRGVEPDHLSELIVLSQQFEQEFCEHERLENQLIARAYRLK